MKHYKIQLTKEQRHQIYKMSFEEFNKNASHYSHWGLCYVLHDQLSFMTNTSTMFWTFSWPSWKAGPLSPPWCSDRVWLVQAAPGQKLQLR